MEDNVENQEIVEDWYNKLLNEELDELDEWEERYLDEGWSGD